MGGRWNLRIRRWEYECELARLCLEENSGDREAAAEALGISLGKLYTLVPVNGRAIPPWDQTRKSLQQSYRRSDPAKTRRKAAEYKVRRMEKLASRPKAEDCVCTGVDHDKGCALA